MLYIYKYACSTNMIVIQIKVKKWLSSTTTIKHAQHATTLMTIKINKIFTIAPKILPIASKT